MRKAHSSIDLLLPSGTNRKMQSRPTLKGAENRFVTTLTAVPTLHSHNSV